MTAFFQDQPQLGNQYLDDGVLQDLLRHHLPPDVFDAIELDLIAMGESVAGPLLELAAQAEREEPRHVPFDPWGNRIDQIRVSDAWKKFDGISAREGIVAIGYEREFGEWTRLYQMAKLYIFNPSSAIYSCPLAMTDGAARAIELFGDDDLKERVYPRLTTRDPVTFWTSGQWMTERSGGSDVSGTETVAKPRPDGSYELHGAKWFTSASTAQMALTLARREGDPEGSRGLSMFIVELGDPSDHSPQGVTVERLKDKLGTKALPTAELTLHGVPAKLVGEPGDGVKNISAMFNITRIYNAICAVSSMRRGIAIARDYASRRKAFGKSLIEQPLHVATLARMQVAFEGSAALTFEIARLLGRDETGAATERDRAVLRLLTPVAKLFTGQVAVATVTEAVECLGGAGYIEDTGLPQLLRNTHVLPIWEGTTNVLSLDVMRAITREDAYPQWHAAIAEQLGTIERHDLAEALAATERALELTGDFLARLATLDDGQIGARELAFSIARVQAATGLLQIAQSEEQPGLRTAAALVWCQDLREPTLGDPVADTAIGTQTAAASPASLPAGA